MMTRIEVRCCCAPNKLLGWLWVDEARTRVGTQILFAATRPFSLSQPIAKRINSRTTTYDSFALTVATFLESDDAEPYSALKAEDVPIELLRRVPGFEENSRGD